jgi:Flp pilus assembly protein TadD
MGSLLAILLIPGAASTPEALHAVMLSRGVPERAIVVAFEASPEIVELAAAVVRNVRDPGGRARALYSAILAMKRSGAIATDRDNTPKARPPKTATEVVRSSRDPGDLDRKAGCYELSVLYVAAARSVGLDAVGVERDESIGTGQIGHIMAGVRMAPDGPLTLFDLQNETTGSQSRVRELDDLELAAHHFNHLAVAAYLNGALQDALSAIGWALDLAPESASFLNNRATILGALGEAAVAAAEAAHAVELAPEVPLYRYQLGRLYLVLGEVELAVVTLRQALDLRPRYSLARRDLGWAYLLEDDPAAAERELRRAFREEASTPEIELYLGLFLLSQGKTAEAAAVAAQGLVRAPSDAALVALARLASGTANDAVVGVTLHLRQVLDSVLAARDRARAPRNPGAAPLR